MEWLANQLETYGCQQITVGMLGKQKPRPPWVDNMIAEVFCGLNRWQIFLKTNADRGWIVVAWAGHPWVRGVPVQLRQGDPQVRTSSR